jgi:glycosyltransferase involved in cell wall biosynthesis
MSFLKRWLKKRVYGWCMRRVFGVMSMGQLGDEFFLYYGADPKRLYRVPFLPDFDTMIDVDPVRLDEFRRRFGLAADRKYLLFSGRLIPLKRVDLIIDAFAEIARQRPDWDLIIVGDGGLADELRRRVPESIRQRVVWTGFLDGDEPALAYHSAHVLLLPSDRDAWGLVVPEAMAAGLVVVASDAVGTAHDLVSDGHSGGTVPVGNLSELKRKILEVTATEAWPRFAERSRAALEQWRKEVDPVAEVRRALIDCGTLDALRPESQGLAALAPSGI